jgi:hypothetical protein
MNSPALQRRSEDMSDHPRIHASGAGILNVIGHSIGASAKLEADAQLIHEKLLLSRIRLTPAAVQLLEASFVASRNATDLLGHALKISQPNRLPHSLRLDTDTPRYLELANESLVLDEQRAHDARVIAESEQRPVLNGADGDGFTAGHFFATDAATAPCGVCGFAVVLGMSHEVSSGEPVHTGCMDDAR